MVAIAVLLAWWAPNCDNDSYPNCDVPIPKYIGDDACDGEPYNTEECGWDDGDCCSPGYFGANCILDFPDCNVTDATVLVMVRVMMSLTKLRSAGWTVAIAVLLAWWAPIVTMTSIPIAPYLFQVGLVMVPVMASLTTLRSVDGMVAIAVLLAILEPVASSIFLIVMYLFRNGLMMVTVMAGLGHTTPRSVDGMVVIVLSPAMLAILVPIATSHFPIARYLFRSLLLLMNLQHGGV
jgi:hypothetical protein